MESGAENIKDSKKEAGEWSIIKARQARTNKMVVKNTKLNRYKLSS